MILSNVLERLYFNNHKIFESNMINENINIPKFKKLISNVYKNGIGILTNDFKNIIENNNINKGVVYDLINTIKPYKNLNKTLNYFEKESDFNWIENSSKNFKNNELIIYVVTGIIIEIIYQLIKNSGEQEPIELTIQKISKKIESIDPKSKIIVKKLINNFKILRK